jgi:GTP cyclohydrolase II
VQDERSGVTFYLRDETRDREEEFVAALEDELGEDVYIADAREAALEAAFRNPEFAAAVLRKYGYDFE